MANLNDREKPNREYTRRLNILLNDEDYGPKLARLRGEAQREALESIRDKGSLPEARELIDRLDRARLERNRVARKRTELQRPLKRIFALGDTINKQFGEEIHSKQELTDLYIAYGEPELTQVLENQIDSTNNYVEYNNASPGRLQWIAAKLAILPMIRYREHSFYYHGRFA